MIRRKFSPSHKREISNIMKAARKRRPHAAHVKFTTEEKSTLRHIMTEHSHKSAALSKKRKPATNKRKGHPGRKPGFHHSAATRKKMSESHARRKRHNVRTARVRKLRTNKKNRNYMKWVRSHRGKQKTVRKVTRRR